MIKNNKETIPNSIMDAIEYLYKELTEKDINFIKNNSSSSVHFGGGMQLRNNWNLWDKESPLNKDFRERYQLFGHGDDVSGVLFKGLWAKVRGDDVNEKINQTIAGYKKHWEEQGLDLLTGERIKKPKSITWHIIDEDIEGNIIWKEKVI